MDTAPHSEIDLIRTLIRKDLKWQAGFLRAHPMMPRQLALYVETGCVYDCVFCKKKSPPPGQDPQNVLKHCQHLLSQNRELRFKDISIASNEALEFPEIIELVRLCSEHGFEKIEIITSGHKLADAGFAASIIQAGANSFSIPLYAPQAETHDAITKAPGSFNDAVSAIENLKQHGGVKIHIHTLVLCDNVEHIDELSAFTSEKFGVAPIAFPVRMKQHAAENPEYAKQIVPTLSQVKKYIKRTSLVGFPRCVINEIRPVKNGSETAAVANSLIFYILGQKYIHADICAQCSSKAKCIGVTAGNIILYGDEGLTAFAE